MEISNKALISTNKGLVRASDMVDKGYDAIYSTAISKNNNPKCKIGNSTNMVCANPKTEFYRITTTNGYFVDVTDHTQVYANQMNPKCIADLDIGDNLFVNSATGFFGSKGNRNSAGKLAQEQMKFEERGIGLRNYVPLITNMADYKAIMHKQIPPTILEGKGETVAAYLGTLFKNTKSKTFNNIEFIRELQILCAHIGIYTIIKDNTISAANKSDITARCRAARHNTDIRARIYSRSITKVTGITRHSVGPSYTLIQNESHSCIVNGLILATG